MSDSAVKAVFLSYASQDAEAARRIGAALRAAGVEVWLDQEGGLVGGDAWDRKIREQIATCTLFVALVSANTQARKEGYFRLEWHLAEERARLIAKGVPFIVPVSIDGTAERGALVPDVFLAVQWTRLPGGEAPAAFVARVGKLLGVATAEPTPTPAARGAPGPPAVASAHSEVAIQNPELPPAVRLPREDAFETFERQRPLWRRALPFVSGVIVTALVGGLAAWRLWPTPASAPVTQFVYPLPEGQTLRDTGRKVIAVSPDGRRFVFLAQGGGLHLRSLDELKAHPIPGAEGTPLNPFFSPDGRSVGYWQSGQLKRIAIKGGTPVVIGAFPDNPFDISWAPDGTILFGREGIFRVPATGGTPAVVIPAQKGHLLGNPQLLPDGDTVLFTEQKAEITSIDEARIVAQKISTGARKVLVESGAGARYLATGHLVYLVGNVLMGVAFDARRLAVTGGAVPVVQGVMRTTGSHFKGTANYGIAADGTLVWVFSATFADSNTWQVGLSDRAGKLTPLALRAGPYEAPRASPDGKRVALGVVAAKESYVAIYDLDGKTALRRLTFGGNSRFPVWSRDGQRVAFQSDREGDLAIFWQRADGTASAERLTKPEKGTGHVPASWSPQDETLLFTVVASTTLGTVGELWTYTRASGTAEAYGNVKDVGPAPMFSPDGRWVVYSVRPYGVFIQPFPATGVQHQGPRGVEPIWSSDGTMLNYGTTLSQWAAVTVTMQPAPAFGNPTPLPKPFPPATTTMPRIYDIMPDDRMIGLITPGQAVGEAETEPPEIRVVLNWTEELKRLVPVK